MKIILKRGESAQSVPLPSIFLPETKGIVTPSHGSGQDVGVILRREPESQQAQGRAKRAGNTCTRRELSGSGHASLRNPSLLRLWAASVTLLLRRRLSPKAGPFTNVFPGVYQFFFFSQV